MLKTRGSLLTNLADVKLAVIFTGAGAIMLVVSLMVLESLLLTQAAVTVMLASVIYLLLRLVRPGVGFKESDDEKQARPLPPSYIAQLLDIIFWGLLAGSLFMLTQGVYSRPLGFLMMVSVMAAILAVQIFSGRNTGYCILKIIVIGILLRASAYYQYPGIAGYDAVAEVALSQQLVANGHIGSFMSDYEHYPIAHFLTAAVSFATGLGIKDSFFILGIVEALSVVFVFLIGRNFFNEKVGLLAALVATVFDWHILWGFYVKAMSLSIALLTMIVFLVLTSWQKKRLLFTIISLLMMSLLILTHTFATAVLAVMLAGGWLLFMVLKRVSFDKGIKQPVTLNIVLLFGCAALAYWMYVSGFTVYIASSIRYALSLDTGNLVVASLPMSVTEEVWVKLPTFIFLFYALLGCLAVFNIRELNQKVLSQVWLALLCGVMVIINFIIFYAPQSGPLIRERWFVFIGLIVAIPVAQGIIAVAGGKRWQGMSALFLLVFLFSGIMTTSHIGNVESVIPWGSGSYLAARQSELTAAESVSRVVAPAEGEKIYADHYYSQIFLYNAGVPTEKVVDFSEVYQEELVEYRGVLVLRDAVIDIASANEEIIMDEARYQSLLNDPQVSLVYDSGTVKALRR